MRRGRRAGMLLAAGVALGAVTLLAGGLPGGVAAPRKAVAAVSQTSPGTIRESDSGPRGLRDALPAEADSAATATTGPAGVAVPAGATGVRWTTGSLLIGGLTRTWLLATPERQGTGRLPLLLVLHGRTVTPAFVAQQSGLLPLVAAGRAVAVYPAGWQRSWAAGPCCGPAAAAHVDDPAFLRALVRQLATRPDTDTRRLALIGFSNGGRMALGLACTRTLAGTAQVRAVIAVEAIATSPCTAGPRAATLVVAGTHDPYVGYDRPSHGPAGTTLPSVQQEVDRWAAAQRCAATVGVPGTLPETRRTCATGPLTLVTVPGGDHTWPAALTPVVEQFLTAALPLPAEAGSADAAA
ncbi:MAG: polyhydroxybutyrate depolymerase [Mycobacterium sp.]|nr:polyhydroxybutyrate depolymerase [Mycobacterium sp.]